MSLENIFGKAIFTYTRQQAIEDGVLIDVTNEAKETGFKIPVAISIDAWDKTVRWTDADEQRHNACQDHRGRLHDVLFMLHVAIAGGVSLVSQHKGEPGMPSGIIFNFLCVPSDLSNHSEPVLQELRCVCGPNDDMTPCMTIMLVSED